MITPIIGARAFRKNSQRGATLITGLVMLIVLTLLVVSGIRSSNVNLRIAGNMQAQAEAVAASQQVIEQVISSADFTVDPAAAATANSMDVTINNMPYTVTVAPPDCKASQTLRNENLNSLDPADQKCIASGADGAGQFRLDAASAVIVTPGPSWCSAQHWEIRARVPDTNTTVVQGVFTRVETGTLCP